MVEQQNNGGAGWKWVAGGLALVVAYQVGYSSGSSQPPSAPLTNSSSAHLATPPAGATDYGLDTDMTMDTVPVVATSSPPAFDVENATEDPLPNVAPTVPPPSQPIPATPRGRNLLADSDLADRAAEQDADPETGGPSSPTYSTPGYAAPNAAAPSYASTVSRGGCAENGTCYGDISTRTGLPKTTYVRGYTRRDGTYVRSHYRSRR